MRVQRTIIYTDEQRAAMAAVLAAGIALQEARAEVTVATERARRAVRHALLLGIHYKELKGLSKSFTYRVLTETLAA